MIKQAALFHAIKPLFANKPLLVVVNKTDVVALDALSAEDRATLDEMAAEAARASGAPSDQVQGLRVALQCGRLFYVILAVSFLGCHGMRNGLLTARRKAATAPFRNTLSRKPIPM